MSNATRAFSVYQAAREHPHRQALITADRSYGFGELAQGVAEREGAVRRSIEGLDRAELVFRADRSAETLLLVYTCLELGTTLVPVHARWPAAAARAHARRMTGSGTVHDPADLVGDDPNPRRRQAAEIHEESILAVVPTSGSTGTPKGVELSRRAFFASAEAHSQHLGWQAEDRWLLTLPLAHVGGLSILTRCLAARRAVVLPPAAERFDPASVSDWVESFRITLLSLVPTQLARLLDSDWQPPRCLRAVLIGGGAASPKLLGRALDRGVPVLATYGSTEACSQVATWEVGTSDPRSGVGRPLHGLETRLAARGGEENHALDEGVLELRGPQLMSAYRTQAGRQPLAADGWLRTGDMARLDARGRLHILGRHDQVIVTGGENVHPSRVEQALERHPAIGAAAVLGIAAEQWGQAVVALLEASGGEARPTDEQLRTFLSETLAGYERPKRVAWVERLPTTPSSKLDRSAIQDLATRLFAATDGR